MSLKVVVTGATGNVGTSVLKALGEDERVGEIVGIARRIRTGSHPRCAGKGRRRVRRPLLVLRGRRRRHPPRVAHPAQPRRGQLELVNVHGSRRVFDTAIAAGVDVLVHASSIGVYSAAPKSVPSTSPGRRRHRFALLRAPQGGVRATLDKLKGRGPRIVRLRPDSSSSAKPAQRSAGCSVARSSRGAAQAGRPRAPAAGPAGRAGRARPRHRERLPARSVGAAGRGCLQHRRRPRPRA